MVRVESASSAANEMKKGAPSIFLDQRLTFRPEWEKEFQADDVPNELAVNKSLETLHLAKCHISYACTKLYADALEVNQTLKTLSIIHCDLGDAAVEVLLKGLKKNTTLTTLDLSGNKIGIGAAEAIADLIRNNTTLREIKLDGYYLGNKGIKIIVDALEANTTLAGLTFTTAISFFEYEKSKVTHLGERGEGFLKRNREKAECEITADRKVTNDILQAMGNILQENPEMSVADFGTHGIKKITACLTFAYSQLTQKSAYANMGHDPLTKKFNFF